MGHKHQSDCYRTFDGVRWPNLLDVCAPEHESLVEELKRKGLRIRMRKHPDGFSRAFIHPDDLQYAEGGES